MFTYVEVTDLTVTSIVRTKVGGLRNFGYRFDILKIKYQYLKIPNRDVENSNLDSGAKIESALAGKFQKLAWKIQTAIEI